MIYFRYFMYAMVYILEVFFSPPIFLILFIVLLSHLQVIIVDYLLDILHYFFCASIEIYYLICLPVHSLMIDLFQFSLYML